MHCGRIWGGRRGDGGWGLGWRTGFPSLLILRGSMAAVVMYYSMPFGSSFLGVMIRELGTRLSERIKILLSIISILDLRRLKTSSHYGRRTWRCIYFEINVNAHDFNSTT